MCGVPRSGRGRKLDAWPCRARGCSLARGCYTRRRVRNPRTGRSRRLRQPPVAGLERWSEVSAAAWSLSQKLGARCRRCSLRSLESWRSEPRATPATARTAAPRRCRCAQTPRVHPSGACVAQWHRLAQMSPRWRRGCSVLTSTQHKPPRWEAGADDSRRHADVAARAW